MASGQNSAPPRVRVGIIGCGEIAQVAHIPTLNFLSHLFKITYLCDVSRDSLTHCQTKVVGGIPQATLSPDELCASPNVDVVMVLSSDEYHAEHGILALTHNKNVFIEKPLALSDKDTDAIIEAEKNSNGQAMVGYMRRYAPIVKDMVSEIGDNPILYARVRDIIGPNSAFVEQSGTFPKRATDFSTADTEDRNKKATDILKQGFEKEAGILPDDNVESRMWRALGGLGSHDLSLMREVLGMPVEVIGAHLQTPFWSALFRYPSFTVMYESGLDSIPRFDAHLEVYTAKKTVRLQYDTPYVKGLPITMHVAENVDGVFQKRTIRRTYEDPYTVELKELHAVVTGEKPVKTTAVDAKQDLEIFRMLVRAAARKD
ncbi:NAD binding Rossmann fold oxidoreductase [Aspergillus steynii IBT 23096]|uniref:NAD binding Rossmann fold oxidoreductase n=1 Tax=Aspergillus steynii IBT 23096 TaxID=1392250 RepID=A0A2I2G137_9EURO|nr:NAD binding Rossmann fold oxidoreductase [Aspergillus steynii IBT 23096]PLB46589.1 NAD binding Rossmann fold oxidoreductase [Aspergillus steynii IBT 23096]